eukprot:277414_1
MGKTASSIRNTPISTDDGYIYCSTDYEGLKRFNIKKNKYDQMIKFSPQDQYQLNKFQGHCCAHLNGFIYFVSHSGSDIFTYDIINDKWKQIDDINRKSWFTSIGYHATAIIVHNNIHLIGGENYNHIIYNIKQNSIQKTFRFNVMTAEPCIVHHATTNKMYMFGGRGSNNSQYTYELFNTFYCSSFIIDEYFIESVQKTLTEICAFSDDASKIIIDYTFSIDDNLVEWIENKNAALITPLWQCGYVLYKNYIITFGGNLNFGKRVTDRITVIDIYNIDIGWKISNMKCPKEQVYHAVVSTDQSSVHLFTRDGTKHFVISIASLMQDIVSIF